MKLFILPFLLLIATASIAKNTDTVQIKQGDLNMKALQTGSYSYLLYVKLKKNGPAQRISLVKINVEAKAYHNKPAFAITQQWDLDTTYHAAYSVFDAKDFSTLYHQSWWKRLGYTMTFDFEAQTVDFGKKGIKGEIPDSIKAIAAKDFKQSFQSYNLNWHADLIVYQLLPYAENRTFIINYYDPGFGAAEKVAYTVTGSDMLTDSHGGKIDCWILNHADNSGSESFWIAKKTKEVLKEEDSSSRGFRYKIKMGISGDL